MSVKENKVDIIELDAIILEILPNAMFRVKLDQNSAEVIVYTSGKLRKNRIKIVVGDRVKVEMSRYDLTKGRVCYRY